MAKKSDVATTDRLTLDHFPEFDRSRARLDMLKAETVSLQAALLAAGGPAQKLGLTSLEAAARSMLDAADPDRLVNLNDLPQEQPSAREIEAQLRVAEKACELAQREHEAQWKAASVKIVGARRDEHVALVGRIAECLDSLVKAIADEQRWFVALRDEGVDAQPGAAGLASYVTSETRETFRLLRSFKFGPWRDRLRQAGYLR